MLMVHQLLDQISLRTEADHYAGTLEEFERHYGQPLPPLPDGITERVYEPGKRHALSADNSVRDGGPMPWPEGDEALTHTAEMCAMKRDEEAAALEEAKAGIQQTEERAAAMLRNQNEPKPE